jgi:hypothetical protein
LRANGSRECAPDDRLREAIHNQSNGENGLLRRFRLRSLSYGGQVAPRNDGQIQPRLRGPATRCARVFYEIHSPRETEGAGNAGCSLHPRPRVRNKTKHTSIVTTGSDGSLRHSLHNGLRLTSCSPRRSGLLSPSSALLLADLTPASGRQNDTTSPSASAPFVTRAARVHRIPPHAGDVRNAPLLGRDGANQ